MNTEQKSENAFTNKGETVCKIFKFNITIRVNKFMLKKKKIDYDLSLFSDPAESSYQIIFFMN